VVSNFQLVEADYRYDAELRRFMHESASDNSMSLRLEREPDYFDALQVEGVNVDVIAAHDRHKIIGVATRSEKPCFVDGAPEPVAVGYLSNVKIAPDYRQLSLLLQGCRFLGELHKRAACEFYLMCILTDNKKVIHFLHNSPQFAFFTSTGDDLPRFEALGLYKTYLLHAARRGSNLSTLQDIAIRRATREDVPHIIDFIRTHGPRRQFFPCYTEEDLSSRCGLLKGLAVRDIFLACQGEKLMGTLGVWDQTHFRQWYVNDHTQYRSLYNYFKDTCTEASSRLPQFDFKSPLDCRMLALACIAEDSHAVFTALLDEIKLSCITEGSMPYLWIGLHEEDPLNESIKREPSFLIESALYAVSWGNTTRDIKGLKKMIPYLELGSL
jgi:hypothetical protein